MNRYHDQMDQLRFTEAQKEQMVERLLRPARPRRAFPVRRTVAAAAAAALVLLGTAGATGVLRPASEVFSDIFGGSAAQTEIIDRIGRPIGASDTADGITITADAIIGDTYSYAIVYTIARDDGAPLVESLEPLGNGLLPLTFTGAADTNVGHMGGMHGGSYFYDADPSDNAIQYVEKMTSDSPLKAGTARAKFRDLSVHTDGDYSTREVVAEGPWSLKFDFAFENTSVSLPAGQSFRLNGMDATLDAVTISPLSIQVDYTVHSQLQWDEERTSGRQSEHDREQTYLYFESLPVYLTLTDGTTLDLSGAGGSISPENGETVCQKSNIFDEILSLDQIESVTVADITIPVAP